MTRSLVVLVVLATSGCAANVRITSNPSGARVLIDGKDTGEKTPTQIHPRAFAGEHAVSVVAEGHDASPPQRATGETSPKLVTWSVIGLATGMWWIPIINLSRGHVRVEPAEMYFDLRTPAAYAPAPPVLGQPVERRRIAKAGTKCAAMPMRTASVNPGIALVIDDLVLSELQQSGFQAIGPDDINSLLGLDKTKQAVGCDDASCAAELGAALGVDYLAAGSISAVEGSTVVTLKLIDVRNTRVLARSSKVVTGQGAIVAQAVAEAVRDVVAQSGL